MSEWTALTPAEMERIRQEGETLLSQLQQQIDQIIQDLRAHTMTAEEARVQFLN